MSAVNAVRHIVPGDVVVVCGLGATGWCPAVFKAITVLYKRTGIPNQLTVFAIAGQGDRGNDLGSVDCLAKYPGLVKEFFTGHMETFRYTIKAAWRGDLELVCMPQGTFARGLALAACGCHSIVTKVGIGTFADPAVKNGKGTKVGPLASQQWVVNDGGQLRYDLSKRKPTVAVVVGTCADPDGNVSLKRCPLRGEASAAVLAVKKNGGLVIFQVGYFVDKLPEAEIDIAGSDIDIIVVRPDTPQTFCFTQRHPLWSLVPGAKVNLERALKVDAWLNRIAKLTPTRTKEDQQVARAGAWLLSQLVKVGAVGNVGVGLPELVAAWLKRAGVMAGLNIKVESGPSGGVAAQGPLFGCMHGATKVQESPEVFAEFEAGIDFAVLGAAQIGANGDVNSSMRGKDLVGPGGMQSIAYGARKIIFLMRATDKRTGDSRFVSEVDEVTFSAEQALAAGKEVYYVTDFAVFKLVQDIGRSGLKPIYRMPGCSGGEIMNRMPFILATPDSKGIDYLPESVVAGENFLLELAE
ncbi:MAG: malonate decarboxylase subunit alpha [Candidatus Buchananbacteria bacterium]